VAPALAARVAGRLWFRLPKAREDRDAERLLASSERFTVDVSGHRIAAWRWGSGPVVVLMHGWGGYAAQMRAFIEPLVRTEHQVVAFDALSHGASDPGALGRRYTTLFEFSDALRAVARGLPGVEAIIAHSGGCAAVSWAISHGELRPRRMVYVAPFGSPARYMTMFRDALGLTDGVMQRFRADAERHFDFRWDDFEPLAMVRRLASAPPLLVIHDREDRETSWQDGADIAAAWPNATLISTSGLGHNRILRDASVVEHAVQFISRQPPPTIRRTATQPG